MSPADKNKTTTTATDTLAKKSRDEGIISGGHLVAKALKAEGVDTILHSVVVILLIFMMAVSMRGSG